MGEYDVEKMIPEAKKHEIREMVGKKLEMAAGIAGGLIQRLPSIEWQLIVANYLSFFKLGDWEQAQSLLTDYLETAGGRKFIKSLKIPGYSQTEEVQAPPFS